MNSNMYMSVEIDFDVFKQLTLLRESENITYNDVIRKLLGIASSQKTLPNKAVDTSSEDWLVKGVRFPVGTEFRASYKGQIWNASVGKGALILNNKKFASPSAAAVSITGGPVNGWRFWECKLAGKNWQLIENLRR